MGKNREHWPAISALFDALADAAPTAREAAIAAAALPSTAEAELRQMLAAADADAPLPFAAQAPSHYQSLAAGTAIGAFTLGPLIGRGGMGEVYRAERSGEGFAQTVAIKLLRPEALRHEGDFAAERRILAALEHPGIARLVDGGLTGDGRPWMAMEFVQGRDLLSHCQQNSLGLAARLALFQQVCEAVGFAHANLVVHRDLKPGNILVTAEGRIKLLDFGIAKLLEHEGGEAQTQRALLTPEYAAPEQLTGGRITVAVDVFALGVVLCQLLAGALPWVGQGALPARLHRARQPQPLAPSALATLNPQAPVPARLLAGDLDAIVEKALRPEAGLRYASVAALWADVQNHLANLPVAARGDARSYRMGKFFRRYRWAVAGVAAVVLALSGGIAATAWQARKAAAQAARAEAVRDFLSSIFEAAKPEVAYGKDVTAKGLLDAGAARIAQQLADQPLLAAELRNTIASAYLQLGDNQAALRLFTAALQQAGGDALQRVRALHGLARVEQVTGAPAAGLAHINQALGLHAAAGLRRPRADEVLITKANLLLLQDAPQQALPLLQQVTASRKALLGEAAADSLTAGRLLARALAATGKAGEGLALIQRLYTLADQRYGAGHPLTAQLRQQLADARLANGEADAAIALMEQTLALQRKALPATHPGLVVSLNSLAGALSSRGQQQRAGALFSESVRLLQAQPLPNLELLASTYNDLAVSDYYGGALDAAEANFRKACALMTQHYGAAHSTTLVGCANVGSMLLERGHLAEAEALFRQLLATTDTAFAEGDARRLDVRLRLAENLLLRQQPQAAERWCREALALAQQHYPDPSSPQAEAYAYLAEWHRQQRQWPQALQAAETASRQFAAVGQAQGDPQKVMALVAAAQAQWPLAAKQADTAAKLYAQQYSPDSWQATGVNALAAAARLAVGECSQALEKRYAELRANYLADHGWQPLAGSLPQQPASRCRG